MIGVAGQDQSQETDPSFPSFYKSNGGSRLPLWESSQKDKFLHKGTDILTLILKTFPPTLVEDLSTEVILMEMRFETVPYKSLKC